MNIETTIQDATDRIVAKHQPDKVILFGSYSRGEGKTNSDIDLFIITRTENTRDTAREIDKTLWD
jgi:predicted nucleotidyltransferase